MQLGEDHGVGVSSVAMSSSAGDAPLASNGITGVGGWRGGCVGAALREQG